MQTYDLHSLKERHNISVPRFATVAPRISGRRDRINTLLILVTKSLPLPYKQAQRKIPRRLPLNCVAFHLTAHW